MHWTEKAVLKKDSAHLSLPVIQVLAVNNMKNIILSISIVLNIALLGVVIFGFIKALEGCVEIPNGRIGVLKNDLEIGYFDNSTKVFTLPKGLVVKEASATGAGWFEPYRFRLVVTSDNENLVDYTNKNIESLPNNSEYYSADIRGNKLQ